MQSELAKIEHWLKTDPEAVNKVQRVMETDLLSTEDVARMTRWSVDHILRLCKAGLLPHIPGKPHKFLHAPLNEALYQMQIGGIMGRNKSKRRKA